MNSIHKIWAEINLNNLENNLNIIKEAAPNSELIAIIKADAYGHGAKQLSTFLQNNGIEFFGVSCVREALELRNNGINGKILILGYTDPKCANILIKYNISQAVYSTEYGEELSQNIADGQKLNIHIKLNTGMNRLGFNCIHSNPYKEIISLLCNDKFSFEGMFTHFAVADSTKNENVSFTNEQYKLYSNVKECLDKEGYIAKYYHICNSAGTLSCPDKHFNAVRPGIILYGLKPDYDFEIDSNFKPLMTLKTVVTSIGELSEGDCVSYGLTFKADSPVRTATLGAGYADGYPRYLSNKGYVIINGKKCNLLGKVCMDQCIVDISHLDNVKIGDEVLLFGESDNTMLSADEIAQIGNTINYEVVCGISRRVPRIYIHNNKIINETDYIDNWGDIVE